MRLCGESSRAKRDLAIYSAPEDENKGAGKRKEVTMYKKLIRLYEPEQKRVYPVKSLRENRRFYLTGSTTLEINF